MTAPTEGFRQHRFAPAPGATRVLLVRHGESAPAHPDRPFPLPTATAIRPSTLTASCSRRTAACRDRSRRRHLRHHPPAPTRPLAALTGLSPAVEPDLREVHLGEWEGGELRVRAAAGDPAFVAAMAAQRWDLIPGAEPLEDFDRRLQDGLSRIVAAHPDQTVVAVVHGGVIGQLLAHAVGVEGFAFVGADNASISELVVHDGRQVLRRFNDTAHLDAPPNVTSV